VRKIILSVALSILAPALGRAESATVDSGAKTQVATHFRFDSRCEPSPVEIIVVGVPANGTVTSEPKDLVVQAQTPRGGQQPVQCVGKTVPGVAIFYQSQRGFVGTDSFRYLRVNPQDANDRFNAEISYTVTVK
jgi:hypothetical protein